MKRRSGPYLTLSANAPIMSAGVMTANIAWNIICASCGMSGEYAENGENHTPRRPSHCSPPMIGFPGANASEYSTIAQSIPTTIMELKLCIIIDSTFFWRTIPP